MNVFRIFTSALKGLGSPPPVPSCNTIRGLPVLAQIAARDGCCPGHLEAKLADMPDAYLAADLPREASAGPGLMAQHAMRS